MRKILQLLLSACLILFVLFQLDFAVKKSFIHFKILAQSRFDYQAVRAGMKGSAIGLSAQAVLPLGSSVTLAPQSLDINTIALRYELFPVRISENSCYILDLRKSIHPRRDQHVYNLPYGARLLADSLCGFVVPPLPVPKLAFPNLVLFVFCFTGVHITAGFLFLKSLKIMDERLSTLWLLGTAYVAGLILLTLPIWLAMVLGMPLTRLSIAGTWALVFVSLFWISRGTPVLLPKPCFHGAKFLTIMAMIFAVCIFFSAVAMPVRDWDAMSHWILKAKVLFHHRHLLFDYTHNNSYPLLWPLSNAMGFALSGGTFDEIVKWNSGILFLAFVSQFIGALGFLNIPKKIIPLVAIVFLTAFYHDPAKGPWAANFLNGNAENLFLASLTAVLAALLYWLNDTRETKRFLLAWLMALGLCCGKLEGMPLLLLIVISLVLFKKSLNLSGKDRLRVMLLLIPLVVPLSWIAWNKTLGTLGPISHFQALPSLEQLKAIVHGITQELIHGSTFPVMLFAAACLYLYPNKRGLSPQEKFLLTAGCALAVFAAASFLGSSPDKIHKDFSDVSSRLFLDALCPLLLFWASRMFYRDGRDGKDDLNRR